MPFDPSLYLKIRLDIPQVLRGVENINDAPIVITKKDNGAYAVFITNLSTYLISAGSPTSISGGTTTVIPPNVITPTMPVGTLAGYPDVQGNWITSIEKVGSTWYGMVHEEGPANYATDTTHKSMAMFVSTNEGLTWSPLTDATSLGTNISNTQPPASGQITGEGDFTMIAGNDGQQYAYGGRYSDWTQIIARSLRTNMTPSEWKKYRAGSFSTAGQNGAEDSVGRAWMGTFASKLPSIANVALVGQDHVVWYGAGGPYTIDGITLALSNDNINFSIVHDPLINWDYNDYTNLNIIGDLYSYAILTNTLDGSRICDPTTTGLYYTWVPKGNTRSQRYTIVQPVKMTLEQTIQVPSVGNMLARYRKSSTSTYISTVAPVIQSGYSLDTRIAYFMTAPPISGEAVNKIEEGFRTVSGLDDYCLNLNGAGVALGYTRNRTSGWLFQNSGTNRVPIYSCVASNGSHFASTNSNADGLGTVVSLLGYGLES
jgi:hypothetical protein